jgi:phosphatidylglycerol:prolipoprotein diacylglycerol transferase
VQGVQVDVTAFVLAFPVIDPVIVAIGPFAIRWYALAYVAGLVGGWLLMRRLVNRPALWGAVKRPSANELDDLLVYVALGVVLGGRLGYVLFYNFSYYLHAPGEIFTVWRGGMSFHGGLTGAIVAMILFARARRLPILPIFDLAGTVAPIGLFFGRIANFINDELWGRQAPPDLPWAMVFPSGGPVPRHPSQLYEAFAEGILLFIVVGLAVRIVGYRRPGLVAGIFGVGYAIARSACEFFREPDPQLGFLFGQNVSALEGGVTMGMLLSIPVLIAGAILIVRALQRPAPDAEAVAPAKDAPA